MSEVSELRKFRIEGEQIVEKRMNLLQEIVSQSSLDLNKQLYNALKLTTQLLGMDIGIVSSVKGNTYTIVEHFAEDADLHNGQSFELGDTYCSITLEQDQVVTIHHMERSPHKRHPCYQAFQLETYIGVPIKIEGELFGTINFSSPYPKISEFLGADRKLITLLGQWVGSVIKRQRTEEELKEREHLYKLISTNTADMVCLHEPDGTYCFVSPSAERILGYKPTELIGKDPSSLIHPTDLQRINEQSHAEALSNNTVHSIQYRIRKKDGEFIWFDTATEPITNEKGEVINLQTTSREITDRKKLELLFEQTQKMAEIGGWEFDLKTGEVFWTDQVYRIHEMSMRDKVNIDETLKFFPGQAREQIQQAMIHTIRTGETYDLTLPFVSAKGTHKWVRAIGDVYTFNDEPQTLRGTFQDVTIQKKSEDKIKTQNEQLQKLTSTRDKLYSIIAHDLKGTFVGIMGMLELTLDNIDQEAVSDQIIKKISKAQLTSEGGYQLLENLLDWVCLQTAQLQAHFDEVYLPVLIQNIIDLLHSAADCKNITITTNFKTGPVITADAEMIATVLRNLISNAIKYSPINETVQVTLTEEEECVLISIKDNGIGMSESVIKSLFNASNRPQRKGTNNEKGTGLGLLLCKEMIELHKGTIAVESEEGKGSEFIITLPLHPQVEKILN
ncbi:MAG: PAS domain S-box protein [Balneolaceae bacterium]|nr:PAS domain S-box protein [Balneolaceae bacterium]